MLSVGTLNFLSDNTTAYESFMTTRSCNMSYLMLHFLLMLKSNSAFIFDLEMLLDT